jgi:tagatose 1,6-diphosphate aldolase
MIKQDVVAALSPHASAVLLDPTYGLVPALHMSRSSGLLMALEKTGYSGKSTYRLTDFDPDWTVEKIKKIGASAVKLLVYYHPGAGELATEIETLVRDTAAACHASDLPLFLEPLSYSLDANVSKSSAEFAAQRPAIVRDTAQRLSALGPDILKMEFPVDAAFDTNEASWQSACTAISEVSTVPWVLLSAGVDFSVFERQALIACQSGASGFLAGRAIWKECVKMPADERQNFLRTTAVERLTRLNEVTLKHGRAWTDFYQPGKVSEDWYMHYS